MESFWRILVGGVIGAVSGFFSAYFLWRIQYNCALRDQRKAALDWLSVEVELNVGKLITSYRGQANAHPFVNAATSL